MKKGRFIVSVFLSLTVLMSGFIVFAFSQARTNTLSGYGFGKDDENGVVYLTRRGLLNDNDGLDTDDRYVFDSYIVTLPQYIYGNYDNEQLKIGKTTVSDVLIHPDKVLYVKYNCKKPINSCSYGFLFADYDLCVNNGSVFPQNSENTEILAVDAGTREDESVFVTADVQNKWLHTGLYRGTMTFCIGVRSK